MGELIAYGSKVTSIFQLIGTLENDITKSIAYKAIEFVENYAVSLGAKFVCEKNQKFTTIDKGHFITEYLREFAKAFFEN